jgi:predicted ATPase
VDTGEGMGQVLPVIALLSLAAYGSMGNYPTFAFEHPELHIHPDAHVHLANKFCETIKSEFSPRIVVETHSENLLLGVQLAIAEGKISPDDVAVHWVQDSLEGATIDIVKFDAKARPIADKWPVDVFAENTKLARLLFEKRRG